MALFPLSDDAIGAVLSHLDQTEQLNLRLVCQRFKRVVEETRVCLDCRSHRASPDQMQTITTRFTHLQSLFCEYLSDKMAEHLASRCRSIRELWVDRANHLTDEGLLILSTLLPHLQNLHLGGASHITSLGIGTLTAWGELRSLFLADCPSLNEDCFRHMGDIRSLRTLDSELPAGGRRLYCSTHEWRTAVNSIALRDCRAADVDLG